MTHKDNPYQNEQGHPLPGELRNFLDFERDKELVRREELSPKEVASLEKDEQHLSEKMSS